jgi:hypothetical protein
MVAGTYNYHYLVSAKERVESTYIERQYILLLNPATSAES